MPFKLVGDNLRQTPEVKTAPPVCEQCGRPMHAGQCTQKGGQNVPTDRKL